MTHIETFRMYLAIAKYHTLLSRSFFMETGKGVFPARGGLLFIGHGFSFVKSSEFYCEFLISYAIPEN